MENCECPPTRPDKDEEGYCMHSLLSAAAFIGRSLMDGADLWIYAVSFTTQGQCKSACGQFRQLELSTAHSAFVKSEERRFQCC